MSLWRSSSGNSKKESQAAASSSKSVEGLALVERYFEAASEELILTLDPSIKRADFSASVKSYVRQKLEADRIEVNVLEQRNLVAALSDRLWTEFEANFKPIEPQVVTDPTLSQSTDSFGQSELPQATQILEEGITVFGMDSDAPVEVNAEFDRPVPSETHEPFAEPEFEPEFKEPDVPLAQPAPEQVQQSPEPVVPEVEEPEEAEVFKLEAVTESQAPRAASQIEIIKERVQPLLLERIDISAAVAMDRLDLARDISDIVADILVEERIQLNQREQRELIERLMHDMLGLGPLEPLLADESITDIMVNGPKQVYVEQKGKLVLSGLSVPG